MEAVVVRVMFIECHRYGYTRGFHTGLDAGTGTGMRMLTQQKPVPVMVMYVAQPNMASRVSHLCLAFTTTSRPCRVSILTILLFYRSYTKVSTQL
jgi:hypothetical protein